MFKNTIIFVKFLVVVTILSSNLLLAEEVTAEKTKKEDYMVDLIETNIRKAEY